MAKFTWEHVHLRSPDPEATAQWYHDKLGADVIRTKNADGSTRHRPEFERAEGVHRDGRSGEDRRAAGVTVSRADHSA